jgi:hypothetical protein
MLTFGAAFLLASAAVLVPTLLHSSVSTFVTRTFGYQLNRPAGFTIWERLNLDTLTGAASWIKPASQVAHGLIIALTGAFAIALLWAPKREDAVGLAGASAAVVSAVLICDGYYSFTYILWLAPLVLVALILSRDERAARPSSAEATNVAGHRRGERQLTTVSTLDRLVRTL